MLLRPGGKLNASCLSRIFFCAFTQKALVNTRCGNHAGSTDTSLWTHYRAGARQYCGNDFPDGLRKNDRLPCNVITPTTKVGGRVYTDL